MVGIQRPGAGPARPYRFPAFEEHSLRNGIRLITCPLGKLPIVTIAVVLNSGSAREPNGKEGIARITAKSSTEGTKKLSGDAISAALERLGTAIQGGADWDSSVFKMTFLKEHLGRVTDILSEVILEPTFPEREVQRLKDERIADIVQTESEPRTLADERFEQFLYTTDSRFARPSEGSRESIASLTRDDLIEFHRNAYTPRDMSVVVAGDVSPDEILRLFSGQFDGWKPAAGSALTAAPNAPARHEALVRIVEKADASQSELRVGHVGLPRNHPDYFPAVVMNAILGGLFGSRINLNLREAHGYTYGASSYFDWRRDAGPFVISTAVETDVTAPALKEIFSEVRRMRAEEVAPSELSLAKDYLDGVFPIRYETTSAIASALANMVIHNLPRDYYDSYRRNVQAVTGAQVQEAAVRHLNPEAMQTLIVGHGTAVRDSVAALGVGAVETR